MRILIAVLALLPAAALQGGQLFGVGVLSGPASVTSTSASTPFVNLDNAVGASPNVLNGAFTVQSNSAVLMGFPQSASGGVTEYQFTYQLLNNTGTPWIGILMELIDPSGNTVTGNPLDFDFPDFDSPVSANGSQWLVTQHTAGILALNGSPLAQGQIMTLSFAMDIPDPGPIAFQFRMTPLATPEPGAAGMFALAGAAAATWFRWSQRKTGGPGN